jgi:hypothetical protein
MERLGPLADPHRSCLLRSHRIVPTPVLRVLTVHRSFRLDLDDPGLWCGTPSTLGWVGSTVNQHCQPMAGGSALGAGGDRSWGEQMGLGRSAAFGLGTLSYFPAADATAVSTEGSVTGSCRSLLLLRGRRPQCRPPSSRSRSTCGEGGVQPSPMRGLLGNACSPHRRDPRRLDGCRLSWSRAVPYIYFTLSLCLSCHRLQC